MLFVHFFIIIPLLMVVLFQVGIAGAPSCCNCQEHWKGKSKLWTCKSIKLFKEQEKRKAAEPVVFVLGSVMLIKSSF